MAAALDEVRELKIIYCFVDSWDDNLEVRVHMTQRPCLEYLPNFRDNVVQELGHSTNEVRRKKAFYIHET